MSSNRCRCDRGFLKDRRQCQHTDTSEHRAIELGHCFILGDRYTKAFNAIEQSLDSTGEKRCVCVCVSSNVVHVFNVSIDRYLTMGCYGIGVTRLLAAAVEILTPNESNIVRWPRRIVPYRVAILPPKVRRASVLFQFDERSIQCLRKAVPKKFMAIILFLLVYWSSTMTTGSSMIALNSRSAIE
jgi:prolyl-tRNA synthetase